MQTPRQQELRGADGSVGLLPAAGALPVSQRLRTCSRDTSPMSMSARQLKQVYMRSGIFKPSDAAMGSSYDASQQQQLLHEVQELKALARSFKPDLALPSPAEMCAANAQSTYFADHGPASPSRRSYSGKANVTKEPTMPREFRRTSTNLQWLDTRSEMASCRSREQLSQASGLDASQRLRREMSSEVLGGERRMGGGSLSRSLSRDLLPERLLDPLVRDSSLDRRVSKRQISSGTASTRSIAWALKSQDMATSSESQFTTAKSGSPSAASSCWGTGTATGSRCSPTARRPVNNVSVAEARRQSGRNCSRSFTESLKEPPVQAQDAAASSSTTGGSSRPESLQGSGVSEETRMLVALKLQAPALEAGGGEVIWRGSQDLLESGRLRPTEMAASGGQRQPSNGTSGYSEPFSRLSKSSIGGEERRVLRRATSSSSIRGRTTASASARAGKAFGRCCRSQRRKSAERQRGRKKTG
eukprot:TRINITY_DN18222_c0_g2_i2.p1 TRINITY_DN18222_c0_g2~~TRINITY_DN18222_c0_g2_i2.p1  ORF type:complete len:473 (-),score=92.40 TRINITY_DN18222_c0_g2_i2:36-1454(-)